MIVKLELMKNRILFALISVALFACSSNEKHPVTEKVSKEKQEVEVFADKVLVVDVDGMTCVHGCGGSIRKGLKETGAVAKVEFDFEEERKTNIAKIHYNSAAISQEKILTILGELNDGQFTVGKSSVEDVTGKVDSDDATGSEEKSKVDAYVPVIEIPNIFELLEGLIL